MPATGQDWIRVAPVLSHDALAMDPGPDARGYLCEAGKFLGPVAPASLEDTVTAKKAHNCEVRYPKLFPL